MCSPTGSSASSETASSAARSATLVGETTSGTGARRRYELRPAGWFIERVVAWQPASALGIELLTCSLPVASLRQDYTLHQAAGRTRLTQIAGSM